MPRIEPVPWADVPEKNASAWSTPSRMADRRRTRRLRVSWPIRCTSTCRMMATVIIITRASTAGQAPGDAAHPQRTARRLRSLQECTQGRRGDRGGCRLRRQPPRLRMTESGPGRRLHKFGGYGFRFLHAGSAEETSRNSGKRCSTAACRLFRPSNRPKLANSPLTRRALCGPMPESVSKLGESESASLAARSPRV